MVHASPYIGQLFICDIGIPPILYRQLNVSHPPVFHNSPFFKHTLCLIHVRLLLFTGASKRVGESIIRLLHQTGFNVFIHYFQSKHLAQSICEELNMTVPHSANTFYFDFQSPSEFTALMDQLMSHWGRLDCLINNAAIFLPTKLSTLTPQDWDLMINPNLKAPFFLSLSASKYLTKSNGIIINISDIRAVYPMRDYSLYCLSKAGLDLLTKQLALEISSGGEGQWHCSRHYFIR